MNGDLNHPAERNEDLQPMVEDQSAPPNRGPFFQRTDWLSAGLTAALAIVVYCITLAPEVTLQFSGEFSVAAMYGGVPFPPGFPLWTMYAWLFAHLLPYSNIAWRVAMSSAVAGALTCGVIALMASRGAASLLEGVSGIERLALKAEQALRVTCGVVGGLAFGLDGTFWNKAVVVEVWPLTMLLLATVLCLLMRWFATPDEKRYLYLAFLFYGLTLTNSQSLAVVAPGMAIVIWLGAPALGRDLFIAATLLLGAVLLAHGLNLFPGPLAAEAHYSGVWGVELIAEVILILLCIGAAIKTGGAFTEWRGVLASASMLALGLSLYLYVPLASHANPPLNWGYARTVEGFVHTLTRGQFESVRPTDSLGRYAEQLWVYGDSVLTSFGVIYALPVLVLFWFVRRMHGRERRWMFGLLALYLCLSLLMVALVNPSSDRASSQLVERFFSASHLVLAIWTGYGLALLGTILIRAKRT